MRKSLSSYLIIVLTMMTMIAMVTLKKQDIIETSKTPDETVQTDNKPEGTGLIFDDDGQNINIPYKPVHKNETNKDNQDDKSSSNEISTDHSRMLNSKKEQLMEIYDEDISFYSVKDKSAKPYDYTEYLKYYNKPVVNEVYIENQIDRIEEKMTVIDKAFLAKASTKLNDSEMYAFKMVLNNNNSENVNELMGMLNKKLSYSEFNKIKEIFYKYDLF